jgi:hypothetical protein
MIKYIIFVTITYVAINVPGVLACCGAFWENKPVLYVVCSNA